jgi:hypothetical protein
MAMVVAPMMVPPVMVPPVAEVANAPRTVVGQDDAATTVWPVVPVIIVGIEGRSIEGAPVEVMTVEVMTGESNATGVERWPGAEAAASEHAARADPSVMKGATTTESAGVKRAATTTKSAGVKRSAAATKSAGVERSAAAPANSAAMEPAAATSAMVTAEADFGRHPIPRGDWCRAGVDRRHRFGALTRYARERQNRGRRKARTYQAMAAPGT